MAPNGTQEPATSVVSVACLSATCTAPSQRPHARGLCCGPRSQRHGVAGEDERCRVIVDGASSVLAAAVGEDGRQEPPDHTARPVVERVWTGRLTRVYMHTARAGLQALGVQVQTTTFSRGRYNTLALLQAFPGHFRQGKSVWDVAPTEASQLWLPLAMRGGHRLLKECRGVV